jgi:uncharacterized membrane protein
MPISYHRFAGSSLGRLAALSDGVFIFWVGQQTQLESFTRSTRALTWIHLSFLLSVTLMPFSTALLAEDTSYRLSIAVYWLNLFALGLVLFISLRYADRAGLIREETTADMRAA